MGWEERDQKRRRYQAQRLREEKGALAIRCPTCDAGPGMYCHGTEYGLHRARRYALLDDSRKEKA